MRYAEREPTIQKLASPIYDDIRMNDLIAAIPEQSERLNHVGV
jgi:hypothetical protein